MVSTSALPVPRLGSQWCTFLVWHKLLICIAYRSYLFTAPVAWPIAKLLDFVLGKGESHTYKKAELKLGATSRSSGIHWQEYNRSFLQFHRQGEEPLRDDEILILNGVLELANKNVSSLMTPMKVSQWHRISWIRLMVLPGRHYYFLWYNTRSRRGQQHVCLHRVRGDRLS